MSDTPSIDSGAVNEATEPSCTCSGISHTDRCRLYAWARRHTAEFLNIQLRVPYEPPPEPTLPIGPTPEDIRKAHGAQTAQVLAMLQAGPQTTASFLEAYIPRFSARIMELRAVGWRIETKRLNAHSSAYILIP